MQEPDCRNCAYYDRAISEHPFNVCEETYDGQMTMLESRGKPQTNADHIRGMTDEELARMLIDNKMCPPGARCSKVKNCEVCFCQWLRQPYEEEE